MEQVELKKDQEIYWTKIVPNCGDFIVFPLKVRTVQPDYFTGIEITGKQTHLFSYKDIGKCVFLDKLEAEEHRAEEENTWYETHKKVRFVTDNAD